MNKRWAIFFTWATAVAVPTAYAQAPILTDEFDAFLVTAETEIGDVVGVIRPVFENPKTITYELIAPVAGGDRRGYLKEGQLDATDVVAIDPDTGEVRLTKHPSDYPGNHYAEVRATNEDGSMDQVLIIIALEAPPTRERALDMFTQRGEAHGVRFVATESVDPKRLQHAVNIAKALLLKDEQGPRKLIEELEKSEAMMTIFKTFDERNTAVSFYMFADDYNSQDLEDEEILPDYTRLGGPLDMRRDASIEEITHLIHNNAITPAYPELQARLERATQKAIDNELYRPWDGLPADSFADEYLSIGVEIWYGNKQRQQHMGPIRDDDGNPMQPAFRLSTGNDVLMTRDNLKTHDPELYEIVAFLFPPPDAFRDAMGWPPSAE